MLTLRQLSREMRPNMLWDLTKFVLGLSLYKAAAVLNGKSPFVALVLGFGVAFVLIEVIHATVQRRSQNSFEAPLSETPAAEEWLYARRDEIYRRTYENE